MQSTLQKKSIEKDKIICELKKNYGLGTSLASKICKIVGFCKNQSFSELKVEQLEQLAVILGKFKTGQVLKKYLSDRLNKLVEIKSYRGIRRIKGYPARGQRTHSNAKTSRMNKRIKT